MQNYDLVLVFARDWMEILQRRQLPWVSVLNSKLVLHAGDAVEDYY